MNESTFREREIKDQDIMKDIANLERENGTLRGQINMTK